MTKDEIFKIVTQNYEEFDLDDIVIDIKMDEAAALNNEGMYAQLEYILLNHGLEWMKRELVDSLPTEEEKKNASESDPLY